MNVAAPRSTPSAAEVGRLLRSLINSTSIAPPFEDSLESGPLPISGGPPARGQAGSMASLPTLSGVGGKAARPQPTYTTRSRRSGIAVASERSDGLWRVGARRSLHR